MRFLEIRVIRHTKCLWQYHASTFGCSHVLVVDMRYFSHSGIRRKFWQMNIGHSLLQQLFCKAFVVCKGVTFTTNPTPLSYIHQSVYLMALQRLKEGLLTKAIHPDGKKLCAQYGGSSSSSTR